MNPSAVEFNVAGIEFIAAVLAAASFFFWLPTVRFRQAIWSCGNLFVVWLLLPNQTSLLVLPIFLASGYAMALLLRRRPSTWLLSGYLTLLVAAFLVLKRYPVLDWVPPPALLGSPLVIFGIPIRDGVLEHVVRITGLSYMLFRQIHFLVDAAQGQIERLSSWTYLNYQINLFTILAGPIQRYQDFDEQWQTLEPALADPQELLQNCMRLCGSAEDRAWSRRSSTKAGTKSSSRWSITAWRAGSSSSSSWSFSIFIRSICTSISPATATS